MCICGACIYMLIRERKYGFVQTIPVNGQVFFGLIGHLSFHAPGGQRAGGTSFLILPQGGGMLLTARTGRPSWAYDVLLPFCREGQFPQDKSKLTYFILFPSSYLFCPPRNFFTFLTAKSGTKIVLFFKTNPACWILILMQLKLI